MAGSKPLIDANALGPLPRVAGSRPVASYDVSGLARAGAALEKGGAVLGAGLAKTGAALAAIEEAKAKYDYAKAGAQLVSGKLELDGSFATDRAYGDRVERYDKELGKRRDQAAALIANPAARQRFIENSEVTLTRARLTQQSHARRQEADANLAYVKEQGDRLIDQAIHAPDEDTRRQAIDSYHALIDGALGRGFVDQERALAMKQSFARRFAGADYLAAVNSGDRARIELANARLKGAPGSGAAVTARIVQLEGERPNPRSSAAGVGQFIDSTWLAAIKRHRPDLAEGRSDAEILALRADRALAWQMTEAYRADNEAYLKRRGIEATPGAQYLAHFLGPGAAAAVLQAPAGKPVAEVLVAVVGRKQAASMVAANPSILQGQLAGSVVNWASRKMGGGDTYDVLKLDPLLRERLIAEGERALHGAKVNDLASFAARVRDADAEALHTGSVTAPIGRSEFIAHFGADDGPRRYQEHQVALARGRAVKELAQMTPAERTATVKTLEPKEGEPNYAVKLQAYEIVRQEAGRIVKRLADDPAAFAIAELAAVNAAWQKLSDTLADPAADAAARKAAAAHYADVALSEQGRVGVAPSGLRLLPQSYRDALLARLGQSRTAEGKPFDVGAAIQAEAALWGEHWPDVYRDIAGKAAALVQVLGSGVKPLAARVLTEFKDVALGDIANDQSAVTLANIRLETREAFAPLRASMAAATGAQASFDAFQAMGEKLTAYYVRQGKSAADAAALAFDDLVGHRYSFVVAGGFFSAGDKYRIPKSILHSPAAIEAGAAKAKKQLASFAPAPVESTARPGFAADLARDGHWVTAPQEQGLMLVYNDMAVRRSDGQPLILSWDELAKLAASAEERGSQHLLQPPPLHLKAGGYTP